MTRNKNSGRIVEHKDGRRGVLYNEDKAVNGKWPVFMWKQNTQPDLMGGWPADIRTEPNVERILVNAADLHVLGMID